MTYPFRKASAGTFGAGVLGRRRALIEAHRGLEEELSAETARPAPDSQAIRRIKKRKLVVKDEIASIERLLAAIDADGHAGRLVDPVLVDLSVVVQAGAGRSGASRGGTVA